MIVYCCVPFDSIRPSLRGPGKYLFLRVPVTRVIRTRTLRPLFLLSFLLLRWDRRRAKYSFAKSSHDTETHSRITRGGEKNHNFPESRATRMIYLYVLRCARCSGSGLYGRVPESSPGILATRRHEREDRGEEAQRAVVRGILNSRRIRATFQRSIMGRLSG